MVQRSWFSLDRNEGRNGDVLQLTITSVTQSSRGDGIFLVTSKKGGQTHFWFGFLGQPTM